MKAIEAVGRTILLIIVLTGSLLLLLELVKPENGQATLAVMFIFAFVASVSVVVEFMLWYTRNK